MVNGIELAVGQKWKTRGGQEVEIVGYDDETNTEFIWDLSPAGSVTDEGYCLSFRYPSDYDLSTLIQDEHGFTPWGGGECPVSYGVKIEYKMKNDPAKVYQGVPDGLRWGHFDLGGDIIAYRVVEQKVKPTGVGAKEEQTISVVVDTETENTEETKYTVKEVFEAIIAEEGFIGLLPSVEQVQKYLAKTNDPDYNLYLQLKAKFE